jgi:DNA-binding transcriptional LysR family regulator
MNIRDMQAFVAVAEAGSVNRAALRLNLTQPATTRRVQNLEAALGVTLLDRRSKPPTLTAQGRQALGQCRRVLRAVADLEASLPEGAAALGELRLGVAQGLAAEVISAPLDAVRRSFPGLRVQVTSDWTGRMIEALRAGALDAVVGLVPQGQAAPGAANAGAASARIGREEVVVAAAADRAPPRRASLAALAGEDWVLNPPGCSYRAALQRACDRARVPLRVAIEVIGRELQLSLVARGAGLGLVPRRQLERSRQRRALRIVPVRDFALVADICMLRGPLADALQAPLDQLQDAAAAALRA